MSKGPRAESGKSTDDHHADASHRAGFFRVAATFPAKGRSELGGHRLLP